MAMVLVTAEFFGQVGPDAANLLAGAGHEVRVRSDAETIHHGREELLQELLPPAEALIVSGRAKLTEAVLARAPRLRIIARRGVGFDNIDLAAAARRGVLVATTPHVVAATVADHVLALLLALAKGLVRQDQGVRRGGWPRDEWSLELAGRKLGLVGFGRIGQAVAQRAAAFGLETWAHDPCFDPSAGRRWGVKPAGLEELLAQADFVSLHLPLTRETRNLFNRDLFNSMKPGAIFINTARGGLVDEAALAETLASGRLAGAGLDVFQTEPLPADSPLRALPNVILTPHAAGNTPECWTAMEVAAAEAVILALQGRRPPHLVEPE